MGIGILRSMLQSNYTDRASTKVSDGVDEELRKFSASGNFNFKKQVSKSEILLT